MGGVGERDWWWVEGLIDGDTWDGFLWVIEVW